MSSKKYLFHKSCAFPYLDSFNFSNLNSFQNSGPIAILGKFSTEICEQLQKEVKEKGIHNFYFFFSDNDVASNCSSVPGQFQDVYMVSHNTERWKHVGYLTDTSKLTFQPQLFNKTFIDKYRDVMIVYDGSKIDEDILPDDLKSTMMHQEGGIEINPVPFVNHMETDVGSIHVSSCNVGGLPQHAFCPLPSHISQIHFKEQWLSSSKDLKEEQYIGYIFKNELFRLKSVALMCRLGSHEQPALSAPTPKNLIVEGLTESGEWEGITDILTFKKTDWNLFTPVSLDFSAHEKDNTTHYKGFRVRVTTWFPGNKSDMLTGLMRVEFKCYENRNWTTPFYPVPHENIIYANFNSTLVDSAPKTVYPESMIAAAKESADKTIHSDPSASVISHEGINNLTSTVASTFPLQTLPCMASNHDVLWCKDKFVDLTELDYEMKSVIPNYTMEIINISEDDLWIRCESQHNLQFMTPDKTVHMDRIGIDVGDCIRLHPKDGHWYVFYAGGNKLD